MKPMTASRTVCLLLLLATAAATADSSVAAARGTHSVSGRLPAALRPVVDETIARTRGVAPAGWLEQEVTADDAAVGADFGISVALEGDTALVGASYDNGGQGAVYVFARENGVWSQKQKLTAADGAPNDWFGQSVALDGDTALIGGSQYLNFGNGVAYVFTRSGGTWSQAQKLSAGDGVGRDQFGISVALHGSTALIGAYGVGFYRGAAYVFNEADGTWTQGQKLTADDASMNADFGVSVALGEATALLGAYGDNAYQGAVYVFANAGGVWSQAQKLTASDGAANDHLGISVALDGDTAFAGAEGATVGDNSHQGAAYVFTAADGTWSQTQKLVSSDGVAWDYFGRSVAVQGTQAMIGAYGPNAQQGAAYFFTSPNGSWNQSQAIIASDAAQGDQFGIWVALSGTNVLIGADGVASYQGAAYFYALPADDTIFANGFDP
jgi:FG-GAP repeat protein